VPNVSITPTKPHTPYLGYGQWPKLRPGKPNFDIQGRSGKEKLMSVSGNPLLKPRPVLSIHSTQFI
jgi:hypothetical protein